MKLVRYQSSTGRILGYLRTDQWANVPISWTDGSEVGKDIATLEVADEVFVDLATVYVQAGEIVPRPTISPVVASSSIPADGSTAFTVSGIPAPSDVRLFGMIADQWQEPSDTVSLTTNLVGEYKLWIEAFPYRRIEVNFNAT